MGFHDDYPFEVKLGRIRSASGAVKSKRFFNTVRKGGRKFRTGEKQRGSNARRSSQSRFHRRVIIKARLIKMDAKGAAAQRLHLNYIERDGTGPNGEPGELFDKGSQAVDRDAFLERGKQDRHQFRFIVSPEDATELTDLKEYTRDLVTQMEHDLGTNLDWVAVNHYDTGQPHTHLVIAGKRDDGTDLIIPRDYISHGIRERAQKLAELELGPVTEIEGRKRLQLMVTQERFTEIDRDLIGRESNQIIDLSATTKSGPQWRQQLQRIRLNHLNHMGLAEPLGKGRWEVSPDLQSTLTRMGERGDIIKAMNRALQDNDFSRMMDASLIFDPTSTGRSSVTGKIIAKGIADDVHDRAYIVIDSVGGKPVYVQIGGEERLPSFRQGDIVTVNAPVIEPRSSDRTIAKIANSYDGRYSTALHMETDKHARPEYVQAHVRRLEALRRAGHVKRLRDGTWTVPKDYLSRVTNYERLQATRRPADITKQSELSLNQMKTARGATWLDEHLRDFKDGENGHGFANEVSRARAERRRFLIKEGYLEKDQQRLSNGQIDKLRADDLTHAGEQISKQLGKAYSPARHQGKISGVYSQTIDRPSGRFAVIERSKEFSLVPWREIMDRNFGRSITGIVRGNQISWSLTKGRTLS